MKTNFAIIVYRLPDGEQGDMDVVHICCYENPPNEIDFNSLKDELKNDKEFGLTEFKDLEFTVINRIDAKEWFDKFKIPEIIEEDESNKSITKSN